MESTAKKTEKMTMEEAVRLAILAHGGEEITEEKLREVAERILREANREEVSESKNTAEETAVIAGGFVEEADEVIGGGIMAEHEPEPEMAKGEEEPDDYIIRFSEPYRFEGKNYAGVDLSGMQNMRAKDIWKIDRNYRNAGNLGILKEMDNEYTCRVAAAASGLPVEFFMGMALADMIKVRTKVSDFFYPKE